MRNIIMWKNIEAAPADAILGLTDLFKEMGFEKHLAKKLISNQLIQEKIGCIKMYREIG